MNDVSPFGTTINIEVVAGGFILTYPKTSDAGDVLCREVFSSPRKLHQKIKEVIDSISLVAEK